MSFGTSVRVAAARTEDGRPKIFWEEARDVRPKKKFNYKAKEQQFPLRSKRNDLVQQPESEPVKVRVPPPKGTAGGPPEGAPKMKRAPAVERPRGPQKRVSVVEPEPILSLTEAQLAKMIETIGKVSKKNALRISIDKDTHQITLEEAAEQNKENQEEADNKKTRRKKKTAGKISKESSTLSSKSSKTDKAVTDDSATKQDGDQQYAETEAEKTETKTDDVKPAGEEDSGSPKPDNESTPVTESTSRPIRYLSLSEKKRLQWEQEKAEEASVYSPWGKPGAGAPITTSEGDVLADYNSRKPQVVQEQILLVSPRSETGHSPTKSAGNSPAKTEVTAHSKPEVASKPEVGSKAEVKGAAEMPIVMPEVPHAMRSSFAIGALAPDENRYQSRKEMEKRRWLAELEQQIQEKKNRNQGVATKDVTSPRHAPLAELSQTRPVSSSAAPQVAPGLNSSLDAMTEVRLSMTHPDVQNKVMVPTFVRGANTMLDPTTLKEMEDKRKRQIEHQRAIQAQVEEKQRLKREAEQKKLEEDLKEERRLQEERDRLTNQFQLEQIKQKKKQEEQAERVQRLKALMDEAEYTAKQEKHNKRVQHLQQHGHDTTLYHRNFEAQNTHRSQTLGGTTTLDQSGHLVTNQAVEPIFVPGLDLTARSHHDNQRGYQATGDYHHGNQPSYHGNQQGYHGNDAGYVENRMLTPSRNRRNHTAMSDPDIHSGKKEFGTQTLKDLDLNADVHEVKSTKTREASAGIEFRKDRLKDIKRSEKVKKVRVLSAKTVPSKKTEPREVRKATRSKRQPPPSDTWNYQNREHKRPQKQSEKDPNYSRHREESLQRRRKRAQELQAMVTANQDRIPATSRSRSRSLSPKTRSKTRSRSRTPESQAQPRKSRLESHEYNQWARRDRQVTPEPEMVSERQHVGQSGHVGQSDHVVQSGHVVQASHVGRERGRSPPVPAVRHRHAHEQIPTGHPDTQGDQRGHYHDHVPTYAPVEDGEFIPFLRSSAFLDPSESMRPLPVSREPTDVEQGRKAYAQNQKPGVYGARMNHIQDTGLDTLLPAQQDKYKHIKKDPIQNPGLVKDHPTTRQEAILQQLSDIRKNLLLKQREIETNMDPTELHAGRT